MSGDPRLRSSLPDNEARLRARIVELEQMLQARDEFLSIAAHELRNPMHSLLLQVSAALQIARQQGASPLVRRLERVQHIVDRYVKRASLLLDVGRMRSHLSAARCLSSRSASSCSRDMRSLLSLSSRASD